MSSRRMSAWPAWRAVSSKEVGEHPHQADRWLRVVAPAALPRVPHVLARASTISPVAR